MVYLTPEARDSLARGSRWMFARPDGESRAMCKTVEVAWSLLQLTQEQCQIREPAGDPLQANGKRMKALMQRL
jgi:hypothetical protein